MIVSKNIFFSFIVWISFIFINSANAAFVRDHDQQIVFDSISSLMWQDNEAVQNSKLSWSEAITYCENLNFGGYEDWRLPSVDELQTIIEFNSFGNNISPIFENKNSDSYWSSTTFAYGSDSAWNVRSFVSKIDTNYARCTRGGQFHDFTTLSDLKTSNFDRDQTQKIVTDTKNGLMWQDDESAKVTVKNWKAANDYCENLTMSDYDDWRLPSITEWQTIINFQLFAPALNLEFVNFVRSNYWSSTVSSFQSDAWVIDADLGKTFSYEKSAIFYVRCVRGEQSLPDTFVNLLYGGTQSVSTQFIKKGWNLVSAFDNFNPITQTDDENNEIIWYYKDETWYATAPSKPSTQMTLSRNNFQTVPALTKGDGFWYKATNDGNQVSVKPYSILGTLKLDMLDNGWNIFGTGTKTTLQEILFKAPNIDSIWVYRDNSWYLWHKNQAIKNNLPSSINELESINATEGFWVNTLPTKYYLKNTGQKTIINEYDDGFYKKGTENLYIQQWVVVLDVITNLYWENEYRISGDWESAKQKCSDYNAIKYGNFDDWRLPTLDELLTLIEYKSISFVDLRINDIFSITGDNNVWTSTEIDSNNATIVRFFDGDIWSKNKSEEAYSRCVRGNLKPNILSRDDSENIVKDDSLGIIWEDRVMDFTEATINGVISKFADISEYKTFEEAINYCEQLNFAGYDNWRLPNINELNSIYNHHAKILNPTFINTLDGQYWSSTDASISNSASSLAMRINQGLDGRIVDKEGKRFVKCICNTQF